MTRVDSCPGGKAIQDRKRRKVIGCIKSSAYWSQGSGSGGGVSTRRVTGKYPDYSWQRWGVVS